MFLVEGFKIIHAKGEMEFIISQIIGFFAVLEIRQFQFMARLSICQVNKDEARRFKAAFFRKTQGLLVKARLLSRSRTLKLLCRNFAFMEVTPYFAFNLG